MNWDQIEKNWAAMARRVRPDLPATNACDALRQPVGTVVENAADDSRQTASQTLSTAREVA